MIKPLWTKSFFWIHLFLRAELGRQELCVESERKRATGGVWNVTDRMHWPVLKKDHAETCVYRFNSEV